MSVFAFVSLARKILLHIRALYAVGLCVGRFRSIIISSKIYISRGERPRDVFHKLPSVRKSFSRAGSARRRRGAQDLPRPCRVKIREVRGRKCVPVAYIIAASSGLSRLLLVPHSRSTSSPISSLFSLFFRADITTRGSPPFRALSTHNRAFACKLDITT